MAKNKSQGGNPLVYSTDPNFSLGESPQEPVATLPPGQQTLKIRLETKHRAGKAVTLITGFEGTDADRETLGKQLKSFCGTGGSVKEDEIIVQGDHRPKILTWLLKNGYQKAKIG